MKLRRMAQVRGVEHAHLAESRTHTKGVTIQVYRPAGRPQYRPAPNPGS